MSDFSLLQEFLEWKSKKSGSADDGGVSTDAASGNTGFNPTDVIGTVASDSNRNVKDAATGSNIEDDNKVESPAKTFSADDYLFSCKKNKGAKSSVASKIFHVSSWLYLAI